LKKQSKMASLVSPVPLDKIPKAITEIESCNAYDTPEMKSAKKQIG
jgi:hypothetical protein